MKRTVIYLIFATALAIGILGLLPELPVRADFSNLTSTVSWMDDFNSSTLDSRWSWIREDPTHWSLTAQPGFLRITTQTGGIYGHYYGAEENILVTDAPAEDFQITTKVTIAPTQNTHTAGILYYQDDDNYLNLVFVYDGGTWVSFHKEIDGNASYLYYPNQVLTSTLYLRIDRNNSTFAGSFSIDGTNWTQVGNQTITLVDPKVGIAACNGPSGVVEIPADFDFYQLSSIAHLYLPTIIK